MVVSTTAAEDASTDASGPALHNVFDTDGEGRWTVAHTRIVSDDKVAIRNQILLWTDGTNAGSSADTKSASDINLVVTTGGTGFAISDVTPEAVAGLIEKPAPGLVHGMLAASLQVTPCEFSVEGTELDAMK